MSTSHSYFENSGEFKESEGDDILMDSQECSTKININHNNAPVNVVPTGSVTINIVIPPFGSEATPKSEDELQEYAILASYAVKNVVKMFQLQESDIVVDGPKPSKSERHSSSGSPSEHSASRLSSQSCSCIITRSSGSTSQMVTNQTLIQVRSPNLKNANSNRPLLSYFSKKIYHTIFRVIVSILAFSIVIALMYYVIVTTQVSEKDRPIIRVRRSDGWFF